MSFHEPERRRPCICRGWITPQDPGDPRSIEDAVADHNTTGGHLTWRRDAILDGELVIPESPSETLRRHMGIPVPAVFRIERDGQAPAAEALPRGRGGAWYAEPWSTESTGEPETIERALDGDR